MKKTHLLILVVLLLFTGCMKKALEPVSVIVPQRSIDYMTEVKPILDNRCVVCHSCYNSPCQLKLSSFEGVDRGASKKAVYNASRLRTMDPTRLFVDAHSTKDWREKEFFSVTESSHSGNKNDSILLQLVNHKMKNPASSGDYYPEADDLTCSEDGTELSSYLKKHPNRGMPFGFPPLKQQEFEIIGGWLVQGAKGPNPGQQAELEAVSPADQAEIDSWEEFLNKRDAKYVMTARYLYEHLFLAHIRFDSEAKDFFELVRSRTPSGEPVDVIPSVRPYDNPGDEFYYRFRKIHSTIVHKTHMVFTLNEATKAKYREIFIKPDWLEEPHVMGYNPAFSANPFLTFQQIPPRSRYEFLLDNAHYTLMTFIRGPVCKGQVALNVVNDHFWLMFLDPEADLTVKYPAFLKLHSQKLRMPAESGSNVRILKTLGHPYHERAAEYFKVRQNYYMSHHFDGMGYDAIWKGEEADDAPLLTVFRHFDSASVHKGALGNLPRSVWVIDYPLFERIYYSLVAGFDVYGNAWHQLTTRLYMDALRREGESNFLDFLPQNKREKIMRSWYQGIDFEEVRYKPTVMPTAIKYDTKDFKREFVEHIVDNHLSKDMGIRFDQVNYLRAGEQYDPLPASYKTKEDFLRAFRTVSKPGTSFFTKVTGYNSNVAYIRIRVPNGEDVVVSVVINRWHDNVTFLFGEKKTLNEEKDGAVFLNGFIGSYPNYFFDMDIAKVPEFLALIENYQGTDEDIAKLGEFGVNRSDEKFWEVYDWFQARFLESEPGTAGLFDLNRYYYLAM